MTARRQRTEDRRNVLVVDDDQRDRERVVGFLTEYFRVEEATSGTEALRLISELIPDCVLLDFDLGQENAIQLMPELVHRGMGVVVYAENGNETTAAMTYRLGGDDYLIKERLSPEVLIRAVDKAICRVSVRRLVDQTLAQRDAQQLSHRMGGRGTKLAVPPVVVGEMGILGPQVELARTLFLELVNEITTTAERTTVHGIFNKSRMLATALGEQGVESREVLELLKHSLSLGRERHDQTETHLYAESCQAAALQVMADLSDHYRQNRVRLEPPALHLN